MSDFYRLVYASKNLLEGTGPEAQAAVEEILETSRRNNARVGVTGALMFNRSAFAQVLEGPQKAVEETFERIQRDARHGDVTVLECRPVGERAFTEWSMAFVGQSPAGHAVWDKLAAESGFDLRRLDGDAVFSMLHGLVLEEEGLAAPPATSPLPAPPPPVSEAKATLERPLATMDVAGLREAIVQLQPTAPARAACEAEGTPSRMIGDAAAIAILKAALAEERGRTSALRSEIDALRVALAQHEGRLAQLRQQRDLWRHRARVLTTALCEELDDAAGAEDSAGRVDETDFPPRAVA